MISIVTNKKSTSLISELKQELSKDRDTYINKQIYKKIEKEISLLGKERLLCNHIRALKNKVKSKNKKELKEMLYLYINLYNTNDMVIKAIKNEIANGNKVLKGRINKSIKKNDIHFEIYRKTLKKARNLYEVGRNHLKRFRRSKFKTLADLMSAGIYETRVKSLLNTLYHKDFKKIVNRMLLSKTMSVFNSLLKLSNRLKSKIITDIKFLRQFNKSKSKAIDHQINEIIEEQVGIINNFAIDYSYKIIHSQEFLNQKDDRVLLISESVK